MKRGIRVAPRAPAPVAFRNARRDDFIALLLEGRFLMFAYLAPGVHAFTARRVSFLRTSMDFSGALPRICRLVLLSSLGLFLSSSLHAQSVLEFPLPATRLPYGIATGSDVALWFTEIDRIGRIATSGVITDFAIGSVNLPNGIAAGAGGALWIPEYRKLGSRPPTATGATGFFPLKGFP